MALVSDMILTLEQLERKKYSGVATITDRNGRKIEYRSQKEISAAIATLKLQISAAENIVPVRQVRIMSRKGL